MGRSIMISNATNPLKESRKESLLRCTGHGHLVNRPTADLLHDDGGAPSWALHGHGHLISLNVD